MDHDTSNKRHEEVERAVRESYGRLVAMLTRRTRDVELAEDVLSEALISALEVWPERGIPEQPEAWLLRVASRKHLDGARKIATALKYSDHIEMCAEELRMHERPPDHRLPLLLMCAHPGIAPSVRAPLMLQVVLGLNAEQIGRAFLVAPSTMGQRLSRAKRKIREAGIPFNPPEDVLVQVDRVAIVCEALYGAFSTGYDSDAPSARRGLTEEAIWLARVLHEATSKHPETGGLLALMLHIEARRDARRGQNQSYVPLQEQDAMLWDRAMIMEAEQVLWDASKHQRPGRFQLEAAIQSAHARRLHGVQTDWVAIELLYRELVRHANTLGARVAHLAALARVKGVEVALEGALRLEEDEPRTRDHQAYWALRAHLEQSLGEDATASFERAIAASEDPAVRSFLRRARDGHGHQGDE